MTAGSVRPYPSYTPSGVPSLGDVPERWNVVPLCAIARMKSVTGKEERELLSVYLDRGVVRFSDVDEKRTNATSEDLSKYQAVDPGDFVLNNQQAWRGSVGVSQHTGIVSPAYLVLSLNSAIAPAYANLLFRDRSMVDQYLICSRGVGTIQRNLYWPSLKRAFTLLPPVPDQSAIVRYIAHVGRRIRKYIRAKQKLIVLLNEQKQAIIHKAVTRGLDPNVKLKPSGVPWLGDVPEHWAVVPIKRAFVSMDYGISESATEAGTIRLLTMGHIRDGRVTVPTDGGVSVVDPALVLQPNDLLFNRTNSAELVGKVGLFRGADAVVTFASYLVRMRPRQQNDSEYLNLLLNDCSVLSAARREAIPSLHQSNLNPTRYGRLHIAIPQLSEQATIVRFLKTATAVQDAAVDRAQREIDLLREYRTRLVADVVTGKLDVREAAAGLPEEAEEAELQDEIGADGDDIEDSVGEAEADGGEAGS